MLNSNQLLHMRERQLLSLMDTCRILTYSSSQDDYNEPIATYTEIAADVPCGLDQRPGEEQGRDRDIIVSYDATIRLPITTTITEKDRIKVTERFGEPITAITYDIASPIQRGPSGIRLTLRKVNV